jgi:cell division protein ZapD
VILYEYPFNERTRTYLRLEQLFIRMGFLIGKEDAIDHHFGLITLFEIMDVAARSDLKNDLLRDVEKHKSQLDSFRGNPSISEAALDNFLQKLHVCADSLNQQTSKANQILLENDLLMSLRSRISIPGGTFGFDLPAYHFWQHQSTEMRKNDLQKWVQPFSPLMESICLILKLIRDSGSLHKVAALKGHFQQSLPQVRAFQLLRLRIDSALNLIPEISGNRLVVSVRLMRYFEFNKLQPSTDDASFEIMFCS